MNKKSDYLFIRIEPKNKKLFKKDAKKELRTLSGFVLFLYAFWKKKTKG